MDKTAQLIAAVLIVSFVIERITATISFIFDKSSPDRGRKVALIVISGALAAVAVWQIDVRVLRDGLQVTTHPRVDLLLTWLVLVAGADKISSFTVAPSPAAAPPPAKPEIHVFIENEKGQPQEVPQAS
jgi:prepilin signal peptidase PulO-like enzyme (type II secretory pathway)